jgi:hypothetical protein
MAKINAMNKMKKYLMQRQRNWRSALWVAMLWGGYATAQVLPCDPPVPAAIHGLAPHYCTTSPSVTLTGSPPGGQFYLDTPNMPPSSALSGNGVLNPSLLQPGAYNIVYSGTYFPTPGSPGCSFYTAASVIVVASPQLTANIGPAACNTCTNGSIILQNAANTGCTYTLTSANGMQYNSASGHFDGLLPGTYVVAAQCPGGCSSQLTATVGVQSGPGGQISFTGLEPHYCVGGVNILPMFGLTGNPPGGTFSMTPPQPDGSPGISPEGSFYPYGWAPGTYVVTYTVVIDGVSYSTSQTTVASPVLELTHDAVSPSCNTCADGQITVGVTGGTAPYTFAITYPNGQTFTQSQPTFSGLPPGTYTIRVEGQGACVNAITVTLESNASSDDCLPSPFNWTYSSSGGVTLVIAPNTPNTTGAYRVCYRYSATGDWICFNVESNTTTIPVDPASGVVYVTVQTICANGNISQPSPVAIIQHPTTPPGCNSPVEIVHEVLSNGNVRLIWYPVQGAQSYRVRFRMDGASGWTMLNAGPNTSVILENLAAGTYIAQVQTLCVGADGSLNDSPWSPGYVFNVGNGEPCPAFVAVFDDNIPTVVCNNSTPVVLNANPPGGNFEGHGVIPGDVVAWFDPAEAGVGTHVITYTYTLSPNCVYTTSIEMTVVGSSQNIEIHGVSPTYCHNPYIDPIILLEGSPAGGWFELLYLSNTPEVPGALSPNGAFFPWQLYPGEYAVVYHIGGECEGSATVYFSVIGAAATISGIQEGQTFCANSNATITLVGAPAGGQFQGPGIVGATNPNGVAFFNPNGLLPGNYYLTYSGTVNGCGYQQTVTFTVQGPAPALIGGLSPQYCSGAATVILSASPAGGMFTLSPTSAGANAITPNGVFSPSALPPGTYTINYYIGPGLVGCGYFTSATVVISGPMQITPTVVQPTCNVCPDGSVTVTVTGGTGPYHYSVQGLGMTAVSASPIFPNLLPGTYSITVTDAAGCSQTITVSLAPQQASCPPPTGLHATQITGASAQLHWNAVPGAQSYTVRYRRVGTNAWTQITVPGTSAFLQGLAANAGYIVQVRSNCNTVAGNFGPTYTFVTSDVLPAMCVNPSPLMVQAQYTTATVFWPPVPGASSYQLQFRRATQNLWTTVNVQAPITGFVINGLLPGTHYVVRIRTRCGNLVASWSPEVPFTTLSGRAADLAAENVALTVYPNPGHGVFQVNFANPTAGVTHVSLIDMAGRTVWSRSWELEEGNHTLTMDVSDTVSSGMYLLKVGQARPVRVVIE